MQNKQLELKKQEEQKYLDTVVVSLKNSLEKKYSEYENIKNEYLDRLLQVDQLPVYSDSKQEEFDKLNQELETRGIDATEGIIQKYRKQIANPYFAKLSIQPHGSTLVRDIRIGKAAYNEDDVMIVDWRSPVAGLYYENLQKNEKTSYVVRNEISGDERKIDVNLKNRVKIDIKDGKIANFYEISESLDVLTLNLEEKSGGQLDNIIETIQAEQDDIIRYNPKASLIVQGVAGSGKTTIAVHRMSYILYMNKDITESNTVFFVNSPVLKKYLYTLVEDLDLSKKIIKNLAEHLILTYSGNNFTDKKITYNDLTKINYKAIDYKNTLSYINKLYQFIDQEIADLNSQIETTTLFQFINKQTYIDELEELSPIEKASFILPILLHLKDEANTVSEYQEEFIKKKSNSFTDRDLDLLDSLILKFESLLAAFNPINTYKKYIKIRKAKFELFDQDDLIGIAIILKNLSGEHYLKSRYKYIFIDEGQDFGLLYYKLIKEFKVGDSVTILGDINQSVDNRGAIKDWLEISSVLDNKPKLFILPISYRNTKQITIENQKILNKINTIYIPEPYERDGDKVEFQDIKTKKALVEEVVAKVKKIRKKNKKSIAIIDSANKDLYKEISAQLKKEKLQLNNVAKTDTFESDGIYYGSSTEIKGLEFSSVIVITPAIDTLTKVNDIKQAYINFSRAINSLTVLQVK